MTSLFFFLSGEHEDLPFSELKAILETEGQAYSINEKLDQVLRLDADPSCVEALRRRAALTRMCALEIFTCEAKMTNIVRAVSSARFDDVMKENETFVVRIKHVKTYSPAINGMSLEKRLGEVILKNRPWLRVKLRGPDKTLIGILTNEKLVFGVKLAEIPAAPFVERRPRRRPFFHPSAMQAKLARCMVNLAHAKSGDLVLDPFCGTGTMLIEAGLIGCRVFGLDVQRRMARGTLKNMAYVGIRPEGLAVADARSMPVNKVDCIVTDPPYGTSSTTLKRTTKKIIEDLLSIVNELLNNGKRICLAAPKKLNIVQVSTGLGYRHIESHFVYVHRSLTREIIVLEKV